MGLLNIDNIKVFIDRKELFCDFSFSFEKGDTYFIVGPSGSGKSTLLNTILGLRKADSGSIKYNDIVLDSKKNKIQFDQILRDNVGVVFQQNALFSEKTIEENVLFPIEKDKDSDIHIKKKEIKDIFCKLNLSDKLEQYPEELSGGQQRVVAFLRAYIKKPSLMILDEPFTGLDQNLVDLFIKLLSDLKNKHNSCIIIISHQYEIADKIGDNILLLKKDRFEKIRADEIEEEIKGTISKNINKKSEADPLKKTHSFLNVLSVFFEEIGSFFQQLFFFPSYYDLKRIFKRLGGLYMNSLSLIGISLFLIGFSITYQSGLPLKMYNSINLLPEIFSKSVHIEIGPLLIGILLGSRIVSGLTSEFGSKKFNRVFDYLDISGVNRRSYLLSEIFLASIPGLLIILTAGLLIASWGGALAYSLIYNESLIAFFKISFNKTGIISFSLIALKSFLFIIIMISQSYYWGNKKKMGAEDIGDHVKSAVVHSAIGVILINVLFVKLFTI